MNTNEQSQQKFFPKEGQLVNNQEGGVRQDKVIKVLDRGFICLKSGKWIGNTEGWY